MAVAGIIALVSGTSNEPKAALICIIGFFAISSWLLFTSDKRREKRQIKRVEQLSDCNEKLKTCTMKHIHGLPIAENTNCQITSMDDKFVFSSGAMNFELDKFKITDMCIKTDKEIQQQYVSSVGGAVGGAVLFGPLGAIIGGRVKKKTIKSEIHNYLIITYQSPEIKYIGFEIIGYGIASANAYINEFKNRQIPEITYQL